MDWRSTKFILYKLSFWELLKYFTLKVARDQCRYRIKWGKNNNVMCTVIAFIKELEIQDSW